MCTNKNSIYNHKSSQHTIDQMCSPKINFNDLNAGTMDYIVQVS